MFNIVTFIFLKIEDKTETEMKQLHLNATCGKVNLQTNKKGRRISRVYFQATNVCAYQWNCTLFLFLVRAKGLTNKPHCHDSEITECTLVKPNSFI